MFSNYQGPCHWRLIDRLQRSVTSGAIAMAVLLSIKAEMPSGPVALVVSKLHGE